MTGKLITSSEGATVCVCVCVRKVLNMGVMHIICDTVLRCVQNELEGRCGRSAGYSTRGGRCATLVALVTLHFWCVTWG